MRSLRDITGAALRFMPRFGVGTVGWLSGSSRLVPIPRFAMAWLAVMPRVGRFITVIENWSSC